MCIVVYFHSYNDVHSFTTSFFLTIFLCQETWWRHSLQSLVLKPYWQELYSNPALNKAVFSMGVDCIFLESNVCHYRNTIEYEKRKCETVSLSKKKKLSWVGSVFLIWCLRTIGFHLSLYCHVQTYTNSYMKSGLCKSSFYRINVFSTPLVSKEFWPIILKKLLIQVSLNVARISAACLTWQHWQWRTKVSFTVCI